MSSNNDWWLDSFLLDPRKLGVDGSRRMLTLKVSPMWGNRKKEHEMTLYVEDADLKELKKTIDELDDTDRLVEIAENEIAEYEKQQKIDLRIKAREIVAKLKLDKDDCPPDIRQHLLELGDVVPGQSAAVPGNTQGESD